MLLVGDVGGTKTTLAVASPASGGRPLMNVAEFQSSRYPDLESIVREYGAGIGQKFEGACFGVAGPVVLGRARITNLPWEMDERQLQDALSLPFVRLVNDLEALANAVPDLDRDDLVSLNVGQPIAGGAMAVIAPGTGLGEAYLTWDGGRYRAHASEGGHTNFAPADAQQVDLLHWMLEQWDHVSNERLCSGLGIPHIYAFLKETGYAAEPAWLTERLEEADDPTPIIVNAALEDIPGNDVCVATLDLFIAILGTEAGNLALKVLATGGVYLGGGIPPRILPALADGRFMQAFCRKGRMSGLMERMPVYVILNVHAPLLGAAHVAMEETRSRTAAEIYYRRE